jgi:DNA-directed RNA polymerase subunit RPC12/RpoP
MPVVLLQLPKTKVIPIDRPQACPYCGGHILQRWGQATKPVKARTGSLALIHRYRCRDCKKTFRHYPEGVDRACHTHSIRQLAGMLSVLGLSYRTVADVFREIGFDLSPSTVWRESQALIRKVNTQNDSDYIQNYTIDIKYVQDVSQNFGVVLALGLGNDKYTILGTLNERNPFSVISWLQPLVAGSGIRLSNLETGTLQFMHSLSQPA